MADDNDFTHPDDIAAVKEVVARAVYADAADAIHGMFDDLARKFSGNKFLTIKTGPRPSPKPAPRFARSDLLRELVCDECGRDYGVYAISLSASGQHMVPKLRDPSADLVGKIKPTFCNLRRAP